MHDDDAGCWFPLPPVRWRNGVLQQEYCREIYESRESDPANEGPRIVDHYEFKWMDVPEVE